MQEFNIESLLKLVGALMGAGGIGAVLTYLLSYKKLKIESPKIQAEAASEKADAVQTLINATTLLVEPLSTRIEYLEKHLTERKNDINELGKKVDSMMKENLRLSTMICRLVEVIEFNLSTREIILARAAQEECGLCGDTANELISEDKKLKQKIDKITKDK